MPHLLIRSAVATAALLAAACASRGPTVSSTTETIRIGGVGAQPTTTLSTVSSTIPGATRVTAPIDRVWSVLPAVLDSLGIPVDRLDNATRVIGTDGHRLRRRLGGVSLSRYLDCGQAQGGPSAETYEVNLVVLTELQAAEAGATMAITVVKATARPVNFAGEYSPCSTTGELEARIGRLITELL